MGSGDGHLIPTGGYAIDKDRDREPIDKSASLIPTTGYRIERVQIWIQIGIQVVVAVKMAADEAIVVSP